MGNSHLTRGQSCLKFLMSKVFQTKFTRLITAIKIGNVSLVRHYYKQKVNFNQYLHNGDTPLHIAVKYNRVEIVKFIGDNVTNLNLNDKNFAGDTALLLAVMNKNMKIIEYLVLKKFVDLNIAENKGFTPFIAACANGDLNLVTFLVKHGANYRLKAKDGQTGLHRAAFYGNVEVVKYLIKDMKMNVLLPDRKGNLPLHLACMKLNITCIRMLSRASNRSAKDMLHFENKYGVKPIDLLVKVLNRMRHIDETINFEADQVEEYIKDKRNVPTWKKAFSPASGHKNSLTERPNIFKFIRMKTSGTNHDIFITENTPTLRRIALSNEQMTPKPQDFTEALSPTLKETEEEELLKFKRIPIEFVPESPSTIPRALPRGSSFGSLDMSPFTNQSASATHKGIKIHSPPALPKEGKSFHRTNTKASAKSVARSATNERMSIFSATGEDGKGVVQFAPMVKSKFAVHISSGNDETPPFVGSKKRLELD